MKSKTWTVFVFPLLFLLVAFGQLYAQEIEPEQISSTELKQTIITPHMEEIISGKNLIYCSTFQIAWNMLQDEFIKDKILLTGDPAMAEFLNKQLSTKDDIAEECYVAMADTLTEEFLLRINKVLKEKFGEHAPPEVKEEIAPVVLRILAYAYLYKNLEFVNEFESLEKPISFHSNEGVVEVKAFGIKEYLLTKEYFDVARQVSIIDYTDEDNFVISLKSKSADDEIVLAKVTPEGNLLKTIQKVSIKKPNDMISAMREGEILKIPKLDFNLTHSFSELIGRFLKNEGWGNWFIRKALQWVRFKLNEKGAVLKSEARIIMEMGVEIHESSPAPRKFIFDKPFLIYLKQKDGKYPYFAMWVDNPELLIKE